MGDACNRGQYISDRSSTRTFHSSATHHSKSSWSIGWGNDDVDTAAQQKKAVEKAPPAVAAAQAPAQLQPAPGVNARAIAAAAPTEAPMKDSTNVKEGVDPAPVTATDKPRVSSNRFATGSNQNSGNVITDRPTTRIHAPPGGRSQISFG